MTTLVVGASGATGQLLVQQLLDQGQQVKVIVRSTHNLPSFFNTEMVSIVEANLLDLSDAELAHHVTGCDAIASCLGHNLTLKGLFGSPRSLVTDAVQRLCTAIKSNQPKTLVKFVLMNTTGNSNRDIPERITFGQQCVITLLRLLLPPHVDNEKAADYLRINIVHDDPTIQWVVVRPDNLTHEATVSAYEIHPSPTRSAIFDAGITSRVNVGHFMAELITNQDLWHQWKGKMPVIYNTSKI
ncbi:MAG: NAD(P)H-binding protein [Gammaproteobacteria bacterium]|nr:NAD(P)H-binding protein [Gammaproteobacteria bacterium]